MAGKRRDKSSKEQTEEEYARVGKAVVGTADRGVWSNVGNTGAMYVALRKLGRRRHWGTGGTTITSERFRRNSRN